jgi:hypothetical protein
VQSPAKPPPIATRSKCVGSFIRSPDPDGKAQKGGCLTQRGIIAPRGQRSRRRRVCFGAAALALAEGALRWDADFPNPRPPRGRLDRLDQSRHLRRKRVPGQKRAGIDNQKQKPGTLHLAAWDRCAGEEAQGLDREGQPIGFMSAKSGDTAPCRPAVDRECRGDAGLSQFDPEPTYVIPRAGARQRGRGPSRCSKRSPTNRRLLAATTTYPAGSGPHECSAVWLLIDRRLSLPETFGRADAAGGASLGCRSEVKGITAPDAGLAIARPSGVGSRFEDSKLCADRRCARSD